MYTPTRYYGSKYKLASKIIKWLPDNQAYCEPFAGGASVFFQRQPSEIEAINDIEENVVTLYRVIADPEKCQHLASFVECTPYSESQYIKAKDILNYKTWQNEIERAWAIYIFLNMGFSSKMLYCNGWSYDKKVTNTIITTWNNRKLLFEQWHKRLSDVHIHCQPASQVIKRMDTERTTFYLDPPYVMETRKGNKAYPSELDNQGHKELVAQLLTLQGAAVLSGYEHETYKPLADAGWKIVKVEVLQSSSPSIGKRDMRKDMRTEVFWINPKCIEQLNRNTLF